MHDPPVPGFIKKIDAEEGKACKYRIPVPGGTGQLDLFCVNIENNQKQRYDIPFHH